MTDRMLLKVTLVVWLSVAALLLVIYLAARWNVLGALAPWTTAPAVWL